MIDLVPNNTLPIMWVIFMAVLIALNKLVFKPTLEIIEARKAKTEGLREKADALSHEVTTRLANYEAEFNKARHEAAHAREEILKGARLQERSILDSARQEAEKILSESRFLIERERGNAEEILRNESKQLADQMVSRVLEKA